MATMWSAHKAERIVRSAPRLNAIVTIVRCVCKSFLLIQTPSRDRTVRVETSVSSIRPYAGVIEKSVPVAHTGGEGLINKVMFVSEFDRRDAKAIASQPRATGMLLCATSNLLAFHNPYVVITMPKVRKTSRNGSKG